MSRAATTPRPTVAVIGGGVSGLTAAHLLGRTHDVTLFEADQRLGGHAHTHEVSTEPGAVLRVDSGFIVMNERTYPNLLRLFAELGVETRPTEMSMSIVCDDCGLAYAGGRGLGGILAEPKRLGDPRFLRMLAQVPRFHRKARRLLETDSDLTWGEFLVEGGFSDYFIQHFAVPLVSCVWSCGDEDARGYPARHLFAFLDHHGMLQVTGSPTWRTVVGGSRAYVDRLAERLDEVRVGEPVTAVERHADGVEVRSAAGVRRFDRVVVATHADQALQLLVDATPEEKADLAAIGYSRNETWLHRDATLLPALPRARASWNYRLASCGGGADKVVVSYWMNRLQGLDDRDEHVVTLNATEHVDPATVTARMTYEHPVFTTEAVAAAARLRTAGGPRLAFAGAHLGWGFHEDGCRSGVEAAESFGATW
ncbi:NAD(P)/FAD-dependent oxidoreductase [Nocardioides albus]|uniref:Putative NAD/FAD-binding protein n=1 Tax=Nocardioides albus TaxID=1841 RepID=A0A7W5A2R3_9ACTN|nr:FAD-dependent oxidoreductase [Nocardioides albus]MBB3088633.1 putative NAD/FAD-binding protein [Nocardioides albus]GGU17594.1 amine oxidase [Nocardioides albus]